MKNDDVIFVHAKHIFNRILYYAIENNKCHRAGQTLAKQAIKT